MTRSRFETALERLDEHFDTIQETFRLTDEEMRDIADIISTRYYRHYKKAT